MAEIISLLIKEAVPPVVKYILFFGQRAAIRRGNCERTEKVRVIVLVGRLFARRNENKNNLHVYDSPNLQAAFLFPPGSFQEDLFRAAFVLMRI